MSGISEIPVEAWEYSLMDVAKGVVGAFKRPAVREEMEILGLPGCIPVRSARAGIIAAIMGLGLNRGASIAVPLYCCPVVLKAVKHAGCRPVFIDIDPATYCMSADDLSAKVARVDAAVAVHMFGNTCDMGALKAAMKGKPIIEDCAQAFGGRVGGKPVGATADIAVFSFRSGKYISAGEGGAVYSPDLTRRDAVRNVLSGLPVPSSRDECLHVLVTYIRTKLRSRPWWGLLGQRIWATYNKQMAFERKSPIALTQPFRSDLMVTQSRIAAIDRLVEAQRANAMHYLHSLGLGPEAFVREPHGSYYNRYSFPIRCASLPDRDRVRAHLRHNGIGTSTPYCELLQEAARHYEYAGDCRESELAFERTLVIPTHYKLTSRDRDRIVRSVNECVSGAARPRTAFAETQ